MKIRDLEKKLNQFEKIYSSFLGAAETPINKKTDENYFINQTHTLTEIIKTIKINKGNTKLYLQKNNHKDLQSFESIIGKQGLKDYINLQEKEAENIKYELKVSSKENTKYVKGLIFKYLNAKKEAVYVKNFLTTS